MSDPRAVLQGIQERADKATGGPWITFDTSSSDPDFNDGLPHILMPASMRDRPTWNEIGYVSEDYPDDAEFIARARADVPKMVAALRAVLDFTVGDKTPIWVAIALDEIIADALGGTDA